MQNNQLKTIIDKVPNVTFDMIDIDNHENEYTYDIEEQYIYGSSRLGVQKPAMQLSNIAGRMAAQKTAINIVGDKRYELSNHLGNVLEVITDKKIRDKENMTTFIADVVAYNDYYPFGMLVPNRNYSSNSYRYGFQGQEMDDEIKGEGNSVNYKYRMHDPRVGRFFAVDPLERNYPHYTPYSFSGNKVIAFGELEGQEEIILIWTGNDWDDTYTKAKFTSTDWLQIKRVYYNEIDYKFHKGQALFYKNKEYYSHQKFDDYHHVLTPKTGILYIDNTGKYPIYSYSDTNEGVPHGDKGLWWKAIKKYNPIYPIADENMSSRDKAYHETIGNVRTATFAVFTAGISVNIKIGAKGLQLANSPIGKGVLETIGQIIAKGDIKNVDISDVAVQALVKNKAAANILKSYLDITIKDGFNPKDLNATLMELGVRILVDKTTPSGDKATAQKYVIDVIKKVERGGIKDALKDDN